MENDVCQRPNVGHVETYGWVEDTIHQPHVTQLIVHPENVGEPVRNGRVGALGQRNQIVQVGACGQRGWSNMGNNVLWGPHGDVGAT